MDSADLSTYGSSKYRRQQLNKAIEQLKKAIPLSQADSDKLSQLQALHFACIYMRKQNLISQMNKFNGFSDMHEMRSEDIFKSICGSHFGISDTIHGFIIAVSRSGHLVYVSDNVINYLGHNSIDVLLSADKFTDILHPMDENTIKSILDGETINQSNNYEFITSWYVSKIRRRVYTRSDTKVKISGKFVANNELFIALCTPMLRVAERDYMDYLVAASPICFTTVHSLDLKFTEICEKGQNILGYNCNELANVSLYEITNFKNLKDLRKNHKSLLNNKSQRGKLETIQLLMKNGSYLNCLINMYYGNNYIICRFQSFTESEMNEYDNYSGIISAYSNSHSTSDDIDGGSDLQMSPSERSSFDGSDNDQFYGGRKRRMEDSNDDYYSYDDDYDSAAESEESNHTPVRITKPTTTATKANKNKKMKSSSTSQNNDCQQTLSVVKAESKIETVPFDSQLQQQQQQHQLTSIYQQQQQQQYYQQMPPFLQYQQPQVYYMNETQQNYMPALNTDFQAQISQNFNLDIDLESINIDLFGNLSSLDATMWTNTNMQFGNLNSSNDDSNNSYNSPVQSPQPLNKYAAATTVGANCASTGIFPTTTSSPTNAFMNDEEYEQLLSMLDDY